MDDCLNMFRFCKLKVKIDSKEKDKKLSQSISEQISKLYGQEQGWVAPPSPKPQQKGINWDLQGDVTKLSVEDLFEKYRLASHEEMDEDDDDEDADKITLEGLLKFCEDLSVAPDDIVMLILFWKFKTKKQFIISKDEWVNGFKSINCKGIKDLINGLPNLRKELNNTNSYKSFYDFAFSYNKKETAKVLDKDMAAATWELILKGKFNDLDKFIDFVKNEYQKPIPKDTWNQVLQFINEIGTNYNKVTSDDGWPLLIDEFVNKMKK